MNSRTNMRSTTKNTLLKVVILGDGGVGKSCLMNRFVSNQFDEHSFHTIGVEFLNKDIEIDGETYTLQIWDTAGQERFKTLRTPFYRGSDICMLTYAVDDKSSFRNLQMWKNEFLYYADVKENIQFPFIVIGNKLQSLAGKLKLDSARPQLNMWVEHIMRGRIGGMMRGNGTPNVHHKCVYCAYHVICSIVVERSIAEYSQLRQLHDRQIIFQLCVSDVEGQEREVSQLEMETWCNENGISACLETSAKTASNVQEAFSVAVQHWIRLETRADKNECIYNDTVDLTKKQSENRTSCCIGSNDD